jgi:type IV secretion system protein TrbL
MSTMIHRNRTRERSAGVRWLLWLLLGHPAHAVQACVGGSCDSVSLFDGMDGNASNASATWLSTIRGLVTPTFWILATIEICWAAAIWVYEKDSLNSLTVEVIKKIMFISFFYAILQNASSWIPTIVASFAYVGKQAADVPELTTDYIIAVGLATCDMIMHAAPHLNIINVWGNIPKYIVAAFCCFGILICFVLMAAEFFCALMESYILFATGAVFLGFGSSTWTKEYVTKYLNYAICVGVRLLVMMLVWALFKLMDQSAPYSWNYVPMLEQLGIAILQCMLFLKAPDMTNALMNGGTGLTHSAVTGAVSSTTGAVAQAGQMAMGAAALAGGAGGALKAATSLAMGGAKMGAAMGGGAMKAATSVVKAGAHGASSAKKGVGNLKKAVHAGTLLAEGEGKSGRAAVLSGLGKAAGAVARNLPGSMVNAIKSVGHNHENQGSSPGPIKRASEALLQKVNAGQSPNPATPGPGGQGGGAMAAAEAPGMFALGEGSILDDGSSDFHPADSGSHVLPLGSTASPTRTSSLRSTNSTVSTVSAWSHGSPPLSRMSSRRSMGDVPPQNPPSEETI